MTSPAVAAPSRIRQVKFTIESLGWRRAAYELLNTRPYQARLDTTFDEAHGTDTAGAVEPGDLGIDDELLRSNAILYLPSPSRVTTWMLDRVDVDPPTTTFVDLGCGKGRVLLLAARRPFRRVVGVEISTELASIARANTGRYRPASELRTEIEVVNDDVTAFDMPDTDLLIHLYHPFEPAVTDAVMQRLSASMASRPRRGVVIAYLAYTAAIAPIADVFARFDWLRLVRYEQSVRGHYNWLIYAT